MNTLAQADVHHALIFVRASSWHDYADLGWLNAPNLPDGDLIFAYDFGPSGNARLIAPLPIAPCTTSIEHSRIRWWPGEEMSEANFSSGRTRVFAHEPGRYVDRSLPKSRSIHRAISFMPCAETLCPTRCS